MDNNTLIAIKNEIVATTNTIGWTHILKLAEQTVVAMERDAIDEEDDTKGNLKRRQAKAAREFYNRFLQTVDAHRRVDAESSADDSFITY